jgi:dihydrofolate reductase
MYGNLKISFVVIVDNQNRFKKNLKMRIWHHHKFVKNLLENETCLIGRKTFDLTNWKGKKSWILTNNKKFKVDGVGIIHNLEDIRLHSEDEKIYVIGGRSLFMQLENEVDEIHLYGFNNKDGDEDWIDINMKNWNPKSYFSNKIWSYVKLEKITKHKKS